MCFHLSITKSAAALQNRYGVDFPEHVFFSPSNHVNAFTHPVLPVIGMENTGSFLPMSWGLIPPWVRDSKFAEKLKKGTLNARSETMLEKPSFRNAAIHGR